MNKRWLSILLSLTVMMSMCFASTAGVFAADAGEAGIEIIEETAPAAADAEAVAAGELGTAMEAVDAGATLSAINYSSMKDTDPTYSSTVANSTFTISMPAGTLVVVHNDPSYYSVKVNGESSYDYTKTDGVYIHAFYAGSGNPTLTIPTKGTTFMVYYAPQTAKLTASTSKKTYSVGRPADSSTVTSFTIKAPANGYLMLNMGDAIGTSSVYYKTNGFKDFEYLYQNDAQRYIGVKKGATYTFKIKSYSPLVGFTYKLVKKSESKYGAKKAKSKALKKKSTYKGLIFTNSKKVHWYKFKNTKLQKVSVVVTHKLSGGGNGGIKITVYDKRGAIGSHIIYPTDGKYATSIYTIGKGNKLVKGTYWIKVQSYNGGNGYFTVKWK